MSLPPGRALYGGTAVQHGCPGLSLGLTRFLDEARTLARFDHPHLNKVYRFFESNGTAYMVLEYVEGRRWQID